MEADREWVAEGADGLRSHHLRGPGSPWTAVPRHRERIVRVVRRRRALATAPNGPAARPRVWADRAGALQRSGNRDIWTRLLDPRRSQSAAEADVGRARVEHDAVRPARSVSLPRGQRQRVDER